MIAAFLIMLYVLIAFGVAMAVCLLETGVRSAAYGILWPLLLVVNTFKYGKKVLAECVEVIKEIVGLA